jgi:hypothetical protein
MWSPLKDAQSGRFGASNNFFSRRTRVPQFAGHYGTATKSTFCYPPTAFGAERRNPDKTKIPPQKMNWTGSRAPCWTIGKFGSYRGLFSINLIMFQRND